jgi:membrane protease YdiL (CAAX protease family)
MPGLPLAALMTVCPVTAALILVYREDGRAGMIALLRRSFDFQRIKTWAWYIPVVLLAPGVAVLSYALMRWMGVPVPAPQFDLPTATSLLLVFFVAALGEELGWSGYAIDPMQERWGALPASLMLGAAWGALHFIPLLQVGRSVAWIAWWSLGTVAMRVIMVWLYNNTGRSVFAVALFHTMSNLAWQLFPIRGSYFDPRIHGLILAAITVLVVIVWGPRTLSRVVPDQRAEARQ